MDEQFQLPTAAEIVARASEGRPAGDLAERLARRFGWGDNPTKRRVLYDRLQRCVETHGARAEALVAEAAMQAQALQAGRKDRYFCKAVVAKLRESGFWGGGPQVT